MRNKTSMTCIRLIALTVLLMLNGIHEITASQQRGRPFIRNYSIKEYRAQQQNWSIAGDTQGMMYFGNGGGLLIFDGHNWELLNLPVMRAIDVDSNGRIYVGVENNAGYFESDPSGTWQFRSFKPMLPEKYRDLTPVYTLYTQGTKVYFQTNEYLFEYQEGKFRIFPAANGFHRSFLVNERIYVRESGLGLLYLDDDSLKLVEGGERFADERIYVMLPYSENEILLITQKQGAFLFSPDNPVKFRKPPEFDEIDRFLGPNWPYCGTVLPDGDFAIGTISAGIIVFSPDGKIKNIFNKKSGLQDNTIYRLFCDRDRNLWAALDNGISRVEYSLPFVHYTEQEGLSGSILFVKYFDQKLFIGTSLNLHMQKPDGSFKIIPDTYGQNFDMFKAKNTLLLAHNPGVYEIKGNQALMLPHTSDLSVTVFCTFKKSPDQLLVGAQNGLDLLSHQPSGWKWKHHIRGFNFPVYIMAEDSSGSFLWVSSNTNLYQVRLNEALDSVVYWREYRAEKGLPSENSWPFRINSGEVVFSTNAGIFRYLAEKDSFERHPDFMMIRGKTIPFLQEPNGDIWFEENAGNFTYYKGVLRFRNGKYEEFRTPFYKFNDCNCNESPPNVCVQPDGTVYFGTNIGLVKYMPEIKLNADHQFNTLIRKVYSRDSLLFGGILVNTFNDSRRVIPEIPWTMHDLTFHYSATFYEDAEKNLFSYRLWGLDTTWSAWAGDTKKEYTNLREGQYTFEVRSRNQYLETGGKAAWSFTIVAPWYRKWWAYAVYVILGGFMVYLLVWFRTRTLKKQSLALEKTVRERTNEIRGQKDNIEKLSRIGKDITSSLSIENIIKTIYQNVNTLMDASVFTIGLYKPDENCLFFPAAIEKGHSLQPFSIPLTDEFRLGVWSFKNRQEVVINDYAEDYAKYVGRKAAPIAGETPESVLYLPLWNKENIFGVISAQSFSKHAYTDYHINMLRNLATYSAIALENADAYRHVTELLEQLRAAQDRLITQSKLAALGELTAGIAHEIQNPLNFVNNFSEVSTELLDELKEEITKGNRKESDHLYNDIRQNLEKISYHGKRADSIVKSMLQHSRGTSGMKQPTDINNLCDEFLRLAYHGLRAKNKSFNARMVTDFDPEIGKINVVPQDIGRVILNLISNAFYAAPLPPTGGFKDPEYHHEPTVWVSTKREGDKVIIKVRDNGPGIPPQILDKIFQPFFTTKPTGEGTGLGLSLAYDIVTKGHGGELKVETQEGEGSEFIIYLPF